MSGVAVHPSPLNDREVYFWTCNGQQQLALEIRSLDISTYTAYQDDGCVKGVVKPTTALASVVHNRTITVYGITTYPDSKGNSVTTVSSLSPVYNPIASISTPSASPGAYTAIAAASDNTTYDYVYFLQDPVNSPQQPNITEYQFNLSNPGNRNSYKRLFPDPASNLAAVLDPSSGKRMMIYQGYQAPTLNYAWSDAGAENPIIGTNAIGGSPLASVLIPYNDKSIDIYLYYVDPIHSLYRVVYTGSAGVWGTPTAVSGAGKVDPSSGLAAVADTKKGGVHVYLSTNGSNYVEYLDSFKKPIALPDNGVHHGLGGREKEGSVNGKA